MEEKRRMHAPLEEPSYHAFDRPARAPSAKGLWIALACAAAVAAGAVFVVALQAAEIAGLKAQLQDRSPFSPTSSWFASLPAQPSHCPAHLPLPYKWVLSGVTPVALQWARGSCWLFASVSLLEYSYRKQGIAAGWLDESEYLKMSQQAFGIAVLDACRRHPSDCFFDQDEIFTGTSTQGGEVTVLYALRSLANTSALPDSVCPYIPTPNHDRQCDGFRDAQRTSPLRFRTEKMRTHYEKNAMREALATRGAMLALSLPTATVRHLLPCTSETAATLRCDPSDDEQCHACPPQRAYAGVECCLLQERAMTTMGGEFYFQSILYA
jgi:hypothetical protein